MKKISIITPTYNEQENVKLIANAIEQVAEKEKNYTFEHIFIDNCSEDDTVKNIEAMIIEQIGRAHV